ncbi:hypothetical protein E3N67_15620 [Salmonella enterica]|nr:hypothetical protein [Salmonella enterica]EBI0139438.1 hypothetical protein [Salmonella enterica subsp. enterica serovar Kiambu]ECD5494689.1 hypothetical protein [Salmonella enterica subsp. enterica serovar Duesseldorf]EAO3094991.1 hypothetical protein [Salmonella enterica]EAQ2573017.1 hypothetical protein [Salmonella enterica]
MTSKNFPIRVALDHRAQPFPSMKKSAFDQILIFFYELLTSSPGLIRRAFSDSYSFTTAI